MKRTKQKNNLKSKSSYLNRLRLNKIVYKRKKYFAGDKHIGGLIFLYKKEKLIECYMYFV